MEALLIVLVLALSGGAQDTSSGSAQDRFAREVVEHFSRGRDDRVAERVRLAPYRASRLVQDLLVEAARHDGRGGEGALACARRIDAHLAESERTLEHGLAARFEEQRELWAGFEEDFALSHEHAREGRWPAALTAAWSAHDLAEEIGSAMMRAEALRLIARLEVDAGEPRKARAALEQALELDARTGPFGLARDEAALGRMDFEAGRYRTALRRFERSEELLAGTGEPSAVRLSDLGAVRALLGRTDEARADLNTALERARADGDEVTEAYCLVALGGMHSAGGNYGEALRHFLAARELSDEVGADVQLMATYAELGDVENALACFHPSAGDGSVREGFAHIAFARALLDAGRAWEVQPALSEAWKVFGELGHDPGLVELLREQARAHLLSGNRALCARDLEKARRVAGSLGVPLLSGLVSLDLAEVSEAPAGRREHLEEALRWGDAGRVAEVRWRALAGLAQLEELGGRFEGARDFAVRAADELERLRDRIPAPRLREVYYADKLDLFRRLVRLSLADGDVAGAFLWSERLKARTLVELARGDQCASVARPADEALARVEELEHELTRLERARTRLAGSGSDPDPTDLDERIDAARASLLRARTNAEVERTAGLRGLASPVSLEELCGRLPEEEAVLSFFVDVDSCGVFLVRRGVSRYLPLATNRAEVAALVDRLEAPTADLRRGAVDVANLGWDVRAGRRLHELLIAPCMPALDGVECLWMVPDGALWALPFAALVSAAEPRPVDPSEAHAYLAGCRFLAVDFALGLLPAASLYATPRQVRPSSALVVGVPRSAGAARPLKYAEVEARTVAQRFATATVLLDGEASEDRVRGAAGAHSWLHVAAHAEWNEARPSFSRIALAGRSPGDHDDWLHAYEVRELDGRVERVVLSSCESLGTAREGVGLLGLARAFLEAGASSVVANHWVSDDEAAAHFMRAYYAAVAEVVSGPEALRRAQLATLRGGRQGLSYAHPFFWAGFVHVGE